MPLKNDVHGLLDYTKNHSSYLGHNADLLSIFEGDLLRYVLGDLKAQLSNEAYKQVQYRVAPINILTRIIDKLSKIYGRSPKRVLVDSKNETQDKKLMDYYIEHFKINERMNFANELFNLHKTVTIEPFAHQLKPQLRVIPSDRSLFYSDDKINPLNPTHWIKSIGKMKNPIGEEVDVYFIYTDNEFLPVDKQGNILTWILNEAQNPSGINIYNKIPSVYINRSYLSLIPTVDTDTLKLTKLIPVILSDLNMAAMYQCFSIIYGIDVDPTNMVMSPNAFWNLKSDPSSDKKPEIGTLKATVDINQVIQLVQSLLVFWMHSKNIRPGSVGTLNQENVASGISKLIDESDTVEDRNAQVPYFINAEADLWNLVINYMHPMWRRSGEIDIKADWSPGVKVVTQFSEQLPLLKRGDLLDEAIKEIGAGLTTKRRALKRLNPDMSEQEIDELLSEVDVENVIEIPSEAQDGMQEEEKTEEVIPPNEEK